MRRLLAVTGAAAVAATALVGVQPAVGAPVTTVKVCVNKKSGEATNLRRGKCRKGWKKVSWSTQGPVGLPGLPGGAGAPGPQGPQGPSGALSLYANGTRVGPLLGSLSPQLFFPSALVDGGLYSYYPSGKVFAAPLPIYFRTADCSGAAYLVSSNEVEARMAAAWAGSQVRFVVRPTSPSYGPIISTWTPSGQWAALPGGGENMYQWSSVGVCTGPTVETGWTISLAQVSNPSDLTPPLTVR